MDMELRLTVFVIRCHGITMRQRQPMTWKELKSSWMMQDGWKEATEYVKKTA